MQSHNGSQLLPISVTLNDLVTVIALILRYFTEFDRFVDYVTVVKDRPNVFWLKLTHKAAQSLCNSCMSYFTYKLVVRLPVIDAHSYIA